MTLKIISKMKLFFNTYKTLFFIISIFLLLRLITIYLSPYIYDVDACAVGNTANELLGGLKQPYYQYEYQNNYGNTLITPFLVAFLFLIFGKTSLAFLLAGIIISLSMLIILYLFVKKFFNAKIAFYASVLFILSPSSYTVSELFVGHGHLHITLFILLALFFFFNFYFIETNQNRNLFFWGLFSGFGIFFSNIFLFILLPCFLFWFLKDKLFFLRKDFFIFIIALFIGLSPWLYVNIQTDFQGLNLFKFGFSDDYSSSEKIKEIFQKSINLLVYDLPSSFNFKDIIFKREILNYTYYLIFLSLLSYLFYKNRIYLANLIKLKSKSTNNINLKQIFLIITIVFFFFIFVISNFIIDGAIHARQYRYITPIFPFLFIIMAIAIFEVSKSKRKLSTLFLTLLIILGIITNIGLISASLEYSFEYGFEKETNPKPLCYEIIGFNFGSKNKLNPDLAFKKCDKLVNEQYRNDCYKWVGIGATDAIGYNPNLIIKVCSMINESYRDNCYLGAGWVVGLSDLFDEENITSDEDCSLFEEKYRPDCYRGVGWVYGWYYGYYPEQGGVECSKLDPKYSKYCYEWLGYVIGEIKGDISLGINDCKKFKEFSSYCCKGLLEFPHREVIDFAPSQDYCKEILKYKA